MQHKNPTERVFKQFISKIIFCNKPNQSAGLSKIKNRNIVNNMSKTCSKSETQVTESSLNQNLRDFFIKNFKRTSKQFDEFFREDSIKFKKKLTVQKNKSVLTTVNEECSDEHVGSNIEENYCDNRNSKEERSEEHICYKLKENIGDSSAVAAAADSSVDPVEAIRSQTNLSIKTYAKTIEKQLYKYYGIKSVDEATCRRLDTDLSLYRKYSAKTSKEVVFEELKPQQQQQQQLIVGKSDVALQTVPWRCSTCCSLDKSHKPAAKTWKKQKAKNFIQKKNVDKKDKQLEQSSNGIKRTSTAKMSLFVENEEIRKSVTEQFLNQMSSKKEDDNERMKSVKTQSEILSSVVNGTKKPLKNSSSFRKVDSAINRPLIQFKTKHSASSPEQKLKLRNPNIYVKSQSCDAVKSMNDHATFCISRNVDCDTFRPTIDHLTKHAAGNLEQNLKPKNQNKYLKSQSCDAVKLMSDQKTYCIIKFQVGNDVENAAEPKAHKYDEKASEQFDEIIGTTVRKEKKHTKSKSSRSFSILDAIEVLEDSTQTGPPGPVVVDVAALDKINVKCPDGYCKRNTKLTQLGWHMAVQHFSTLAMSYLEPNQVEPLNIIVANICWCTRRAVKLFMLKNKVVDIGCRFYKNYLPIVAMVRPVTSTELGNRLLYGEAPSKKYLMIWFTGIALESCPINIAVTFGSGSSAICRNVKLYSIQKNQCLFEVYVSGNAILLTEEAISIMTQGENLILKGQIVVL